jgi:hypothetical protein
MGIVHKSNYADLTMGLSSTISEFLAQGRNMSTLSADIFPSPNLDLVRRACKPEKNGASDGEAEFPSTDSVILSATELSLQSEMQQFQQSYVSDHEKMQGVYLTRVSTLAHEWNLEAIDNEEEEIVTSVIARAKENAGFVLRPLETLRAAGKELLLFRNRHSLMHRLPVQSSPSRVLSLLLLAFAIELIFSFTLTREVGDPQQILMLALAFSFLNCIVPFLVSRYCIAINYRPGISFETDLRKWLAWFLTLSLLTLGVVLNLLMAHYRAIVNEIAVGAAANPGDLEGLVARAASVSTESLDRLMDQVFRFGDTWSFLLFLIGFACFLIAFIDGFTAQDRYPKYSALEKRFNQALDEYQGTVSEIIDELKEEQEEAVSKIENFKRGIKDSYSRVPETVSRSRALHSNCENALRTLDSRLMQLVQEYRSANQKARGTEPPSYFNELVKLERKELSVPGFPNLDAKVKEKLEDRLAEFVETLHGQFKTLIEDIKPADTVLEEYPLQVKTIDG